VRSLGFADGRLPRLPGTRREAATILSLVPPGLGLQALDFEASRELAAGGDLARYRVVHFATHGLLDTERPELSGIVLSLVDRDGRPRNGFLRMHELYTLRLPVDLVVLSACRTALGRELRGEGLVGLTRGFMYAGAPKVLASLWTVDDRATAELMGHFYRGLLGPARLRPAAALRAAQEAVRSQKRWAHPYYWAGFVLHGDWK
jgi:CHAT domain-containing protein